MNNSQVQQAFINRQPGQSTNLSTDGHILKSYHWWEMARWDSLTIIIRKGLSYSQTTSRHRSGILCGIPASIETPYYQSNMEL